MNNDFNNQQPVQPVQPVAPVAPVEPVAQPVQTVAPMADIAPVQPVPVQEVKKKSKLPIIIIILLLVIVGGGVGVYFAFFNKVSSRQVINGAMNQVFGKILQAGNKLDDFVVIDYKNDIVESDGVIKFSTEGTMNGEKVNYDDVLFNYNVKVNAKDLSMSTKVSTSEGNKEIVKLDSFVENKVLYMNSNIFQAPLKYDMSGESFWADLEEGVKQLPKYTKSDTQKVIGAVKRYLNNSIKDEYLSQESGNYTIDGVNVSGLKTTLTIDYKTYLEMSKSVMSQLVVDEETLNIIANYSFTSVQDLKDALSDDVKNIEEELKNPNPDSSEVKIVINIYTTKHGKFLALEGKTNEAVFITAVVEDKITTYKFYEDNKESFKLTYNEASKEYIFKLDKYDVTATIIDDGIKFAVDIDGVKVDIIVTSKSTAEELNTKLEINGNINEDSVKGNIKLEYSNTIRKASAIDKFDASNAQDISTLTQEQLFAMLDTFTINSTGTYLETVALLLQMSVMDQRQTLQNGHVIEDF